MKTVFTILTSLVFVMFLYTIAYPQDYDGMQKQILDIQTKMGNAYKLKARHEYEAALKAFIENIVLLENTRESAKYIPGMEETMDKMIIRVTQDIGNCYRESSDLERAREYYEKATSLARKSQDYLTELEVIFDLFKLYRDSYDYKNTFITCSLVGNKLSSIDKKDINSDEKIMKYLRILDEARKAYLDIVQLNYDMRKCDDVTKMLNDPSFLELQKLLESINAETLERKYRELTNAQVEPIKIANICGLYFTINTSNIYNKFLIITNKGMCLCQKGDFDQALSTFDEAKRYVESIDLSKQKRIIDQIKSELSKDAELLPEQDRDSVIEILSTFRDKDTDLLGTLSLINNKFHRGHTYQKMGEYEKALELYREIIKECETIPFYKKSILQRVFPFMGECYFETAQFDKAMQMAIESKKLFEKSWFSLDLKWRSDNLIGKIHERNGEMEKACDAYKTAVESIESLRPSFGLSIEEFYDDRLEPFEGKIRMLIAKGKFDEALNYVEKSKAKTVSEHLGIIALGGKLPEKESKKYHNLVSLETKCRERLKELENSNISSGEIMKEQSKLVKAQMDIRGLLESQTEDFSNLVLGKISPIRDIQKFLDDDSIIFEYFYDVASPEKLRKVYLWTITSSNIELLTLNITPQELGNKVRFLRKRIADRSDKWQENSSELYQDIIKPGEKFLAGRKRLIIVPHKVLYYLPFELLADEQGNLLIKKHSVAYEPSINVLRLCRDMKKPTGDRVVAFALGNAAPEKDISPLPGTSKEVDDIKSVLPNTTVRKERDFTKEKIRNDVKEKNFIHFATHGVVDGDNPKASCLITADGRLTVEEILDSVTLVLQSNLVTLSACNTGVGKLYAGDDQVGLTRALMSTGTPSILSSLWSVSDESTAKLMKYFYSNISQKMDKSEALRQAELKLMEEYPHPFYWAPFILTGDWM